MTFQIVHDGPWVKEIWVFLLLFSAPEEFFSTTNCVAWVDLNLDKELGHGNLPWDWRYVFHEGVYTI